MGSLLQALFDEDGILGLVKSGFGCMILLSVVIQLLPLIPVIAVIYVLSKSFGSSKPSSG